MKKIILTLALSLAAVGLSAQVTTIQLTYDQKSGTAGETIGLDGKTYGPYKELVNTTFSTLNTAVVFAATKKDKTYFVTKSGETGPLTAGYQLSNLTISDDGSVWSATASKPGATEDDPYTYQLTVNGKTFGPYQDVSSFEWAETGGSWIAAVKVAEGEYKVLMNGKIMGSFAGVDRAWISLDGSFWGYATQDKDGNQFLVTSDKAIGAIENGNFGNLNFRDPHWAYSYRLPGQTEEVLVVDGQKIPGYTNFNSLIYSVSGKYWAFEATKVNPDGDDHPVIYFNGKDYLGQYLQAVRVGNQEYFFYNVVDGTKTTVQALKLP